MRRPRTRACLEQGLCLNFNFLARTKIIEAGGLTINRSIGWSDSSGDVAVGIISAFLIGHTGWVTIEIEGKKQSIDVISEGRHLADASIIFCARRPGEKHRSSGVPQEPKNFGSRQGWGKRVAYVPRQHP